MTYRKTVSIPFAGPIPTDLQPGQWVKFGNSKRSSRFVGYHSDEKGNRRGIVVRPVGRNTVSTAAFRLARDKAKTVVLGTILTPR